MARTARSFLWLAPAVVALGCASTDGPTAPTSADAEVSLAAGWQFLWAAGDIADCDTPWDEQTAALLQAVAGSGTIAPLGDNVYDRGTTWEFANCYHPSWGRLRSRSRPVIGNHEVMTAPYDGSAYYNYFGAAAGPRGKGYYSYDLGGWHVVVLNTNCQHFKDRSCAVGSAQERWLRQDLATHPTLCTVAMAHHPWVRNPYVQPLFQALYDHGVEVLLSGDDHFYEVFARQDPRFNWAENGVRQFVVGTGGAGLHDPPPPYRNSLKRIKRHGVLKLILMPDRYAWRFIAVNKAIYDGGESPCR